MTLNSIILEGKKIHKVPVTGNDRNVETFSFNFEICNWISLDR